MFSDSIHNKFHIDLGSSQWLSGMGKKIDKVYAKGYSPNGPKHHILASKHFVTLRLTIESAQNRTTCLVASEASIFS